jgi:peroxiredoxin
VRGICWWLVDQLSRLLAPDESDFVRGDLAETGASGGHALRDVLGLVARRQAGLWRDWRPWLALVALVPLSWLLSLHARYTAHNSSIYLWMYANNWDWPLLRLPGFRPELAGYMADILGSYLALACWSWTGGLALAWVSRRAAPLTGALFCLALMVIPAAPGFRFLGPFPPFHANDAVFAVAFYRVVFPSLVQITLVAAPAIAGVRHGLRLAAARPLARILLGVSMFISFVYLTSIVWVPLPLRHAWVAPLALLVYWPVAYLSGRSLARLWRGKSARVAALLAALAGIAAAADPATVRAALQPDAGRKPAPEIRLKDGSGKTVTLKKYRGKVVLLDFWATWCHGCKEEIPWFADFQRRYGGKGLRVVGVSMDDDGWKVVKPFLETAQVPYRIVLGDGPTAKQYGIENMPDTFLIDRHGRIAAAYTGLVDKDDVEANLRTMLAQR